MPVEVVTRRWPSTALGRSKRVNIVLPDGYADRGPGHPVLYLLHGYGGGRDTWLLRTGLVELVRDSRLIVVLPESGRRWFINDHAGLRYEDYLVQDLVPAVDAGFNTRADRSSRAVGGFSMGGAAALFLTLRHPSVFGAAVSHAGAFEAPLRRGDPYAAHRADPGFVMPTEASHQRVWGPPGSATRLLYDPYRLIGRPPAGPRSPLHLDVGTGDYDRVIRMNRRTRDALRSGGWSPEYHERPGGHDMDFVNSALPAAMAFVARHLTGANANGVSFV
ncbi:alpha/beta hydrolase family protein [Streptomyces sp. ME19-01-6]|uniref:alpha/beta hydrolase n=1 Tax=Streptomyces sp. ME19-01-6 TaxID=3028686 RepID=UPI0029B462CF|nr:alpha/beta hydrolase family protein [Streptomyces sp. ME19-01-6]MDX3225473.1 alpha/beta hydrolase family protein [Streptomyces sp. ME19-01-6]